MLKHRITYDKKGRLPQVFDTRRHYKNLGMYSLRCLQDHDIEPIRLWRNEQMTVLRQREKLTNEQQNNYFATCVWPSMVKMNPEQILFALEKNQQFIGYGGLVHISWPDKRAEISFLVAPERAKDPSIYEEDMLHFFAMIKQAGFTELGFEKLYTETYSSRVEHIKLLEKSGMVLEACLKKHVLIGANRLDSLIHAVFK